MLFTLFRPGAAELSCRQLASGSYPSCLPLQAERPELEGQRQALLQSEQALRVQLVALEKQLLEALASSRWDSADGGGREAVLWCRC